MTSITPTPARAKIKIVIDPLLAALLPVVVAVAVGVAVCGVAACGVVVCVEVSVGVATTVGDAATAVTVRAAALMSWSEGSFSALTLTVIHARSSSDRNGQRNTKIALRVRRRTIAGDHTILIWRHNAN